MSRKRKYSEVKGYWVYSISIPSVGKFYIGVSKLQCSQRWNKSTYKDNSLEPYLDEWENMVKTVIQDNLTKEEAYQLEDALIQALNDLCINSNRSGMITDDINAYQKEYQKQWKLNNPEYHKQYNENPEYRERNNQRSKQWQKDNKEKINEKRKQRYQNDAEFREHEKQRAKQNRLKKKLEQQNQQLNLI